MNELIVCIGVSGSGKSTWTQDFLEDNPQYLRINRDDLRKTIVKSLKRYYRRTDLHLIEEIITDLESQLLINYNDFNKCVIVDNTNLNKKVIEHWIKEAQYYGYEVKFKLFDVDLHIAKSRVLFRDDLYWEDLKYIDKQINQYNEIKKWILENYKQYMIGNG